MAGSGARSPPAPPRGTPRGPGSGGRSACDRTWDRGANRSARPCRTASARETAPGPKLHRASILLRQCRPAARPPGGEADVDQERPNGTLADDRALTPDPSAWSAPRARPSLQPRENATTYGSGRGPGYGRCILARYA